MGSFIDMCRQGTANPEDFDDFVEKWHQSESPLTIYEFLGMSVEEYAVVLTSDDVCECIKRLVEDGEEDRHSCALRSEKECADGL